MNAEKVVKVLSGRKARGDRVKCCQDLKRRQWTARRAQGLAGDSRGEA
jgi:hypothetical protein